MTDAESIHEFDTVRIIHLQKERDDRISEVVRLNAIVNEIASQSKLGITSMSYFPFDDDIVTEVGLPTIDIRGTTFAPKDFPLLCEYLKEHSKDTT